MCDVCSAEGIDFKFVNGPKDKLHNCKLFRVYIGQIARVKLCHLHDIQLFSMGENRFLKEHLCLAQLLSSQKSTFVD
ncbi:MAG: hypothetical protein HN509_05875 [Halobacteriovoraceae bacterium]|jgi:hypothetical protein|nr:hypothetical protein [Halobacteriovoraceae bacterium]MBT5095401.1 hypothetical protein [Halobacteriovoraceae bacterium]